MGGIAFRAPVLAALFLIVALATLAMPGSANFVGEFLILLGVVQARSWRSRSSRSTGVVLASVYALRHVHPLDAQPRRAEGRRRSSCRSRDGLVLVPLVLAILAFALYPQRRAATPGEAAVEPTVQRGGQR